MTRPPVVLVSGYARVRVREYGGRGGTLALPDADIPRCGRMAFAAATSAEMHAGRQPRTLRGRADRGTGHAEAGRATSLPKRRGAMADELILTERRGATEGILWLTFNRPEKLNALTMPLLAELLEVFRRAREDRSVRCVVITGAGRGFCA